MLASLLPGLRDFRTPLVTGALYFLTLWLWFGGERLLPESHPDSLAMQRVQGLAGQLGPGVTIAVVALAAYLVGSLAVVRTPPRILHEEGTLLAHFLIRLPKPRFARRLAARSDWLQRFYYRALLPVTTAQVPGAQYDLPYDVVRWAFDRTAALEDRVNYYKLGALGEAYSDAWDHLYLGQENVREERRRSDSLRHAVMVSIRGELDVLVIRMQIERESMWNEYDRLRSEAELRLSIVPPMAALLAVLVVLSSPWWLLAVVLPGVFLAQGAAQYRAATRRVWELLVHGVITSPAIEALEASTRDDTPFDPGVDPETLSEA